MRVGRGEGNGKGWSLERVMGVEVWEVLWTLVLVIGSNEDIVGAK